VNQSTLQTAFHKGAIGKKIIRIAIKPSFAKHHRHDAARHASILVPGACQNNGEEKKPDHPAPFN